MEQNENKQVQQQKSEKKPTHNPVEFLSTQPEEFKSLVSIYSSCISSAASKQDTISLLNSSLITDYDLPETVSLSIASHIYDFISSPEFTTSYINDNNANITNTSSSNNNGKDETPTLYISLKDYVQFYKRTQGQPQQIKLLLLALIAFYRYNYHKSGWVHYERKAIMHLASLTKLGTSRQEKLLNTLHKDFGFDMRVIGSTQPIPCYKFAWLTDQQEDIGDPDTNPLIPFGKFNPSTIKDMIAKLDAEGLLDISTVGEVTEEKGKDPMVIVKLDEEEEENESNKKEEVKTDNE